MSYRLEIMSSFLPEKEYLRYGAVLFLQNKTAAESHRFLIEIVRTPNRFGMKTMFCIYSGQSDIVYYELRRPKPTTPLIQNTITNK